MSNNYGNNNGNNDHNINGKENNLSTNKLKKLGVD